MGQKTIEKALDECLRAADPLAAAARFPTLEAKLLPLIRTAQRVRSVPPAIASPRAKARGLELGMMKQRLRAQTRQARQEGLLDEAA